MVIKCSRSFLSKSDHNFRMFQWKSKNSIPNAISVLFWRTKDQHRPLINYNSQLFPGRNKAGTMEGVMSDIHHLPSLSHIAQRFLSSYCFSFDQYRDPLPSLLSPLSSLLSLLSVWLEVSTLHRKTALFST